MRKSGTGVSSSAYAGRSRIIYVDSLTCFDQMGYALFFLYFYRLTNANSKYLREIDLNRCSTVDDFHYSLDDRFWHVADLILGVKSRI
jgi:hypothetical protein